MTPLVLTFNEAPNIGRWLEGLAWARQIIVMDSGSTDGTLDLLKDLPQVRVIHRDWDHFAGQRNAGLEHVQTPWVLSLDADHMASPQLASALAAALEDPLYSAYRAPFQYWIHGRPIRGAVLPPREVLFRPDRCRYEPDGHSERLLVEGNTGDLDAVLYHDDRKSLSRWLSSQLTYARQESAKLTTVAANQLSRADRIRSKTLLGPLLVPAVSLFRGAFLSGWRGLYYLAQRALAELLLVLWLLERRAGQAKPDGASGDGE